MKNTSLLVLLFLFVFAVSISAQNAVADPKVDTFLTQKGITEALPGVEYTGSAYVDESFQLGTVYRDGKILVSSAALRYNALRDEFEFKQNLNSPNETARILSKSKSLYVKIKNHLVVFSEVTSETSKPGYFEVLHEGEPFSLYKKVKKQYIEGKKAINSISSDILPNLKEKEMLFLVKTGTEFTELAGSRGGKVNGFGDNKKTLKKFVKENELNLNRNKDLAKLVAYYNTLTSK